VFVQYNGEMFHHVFDETGMAVLKAPNSDRLRKCVDMGELVWLRAQTTKPGKKLGRKLILKFKEFLGKPSQLCDPSTCPVEVRKYVR
jgi:hypothetical protein